MKVKLVKARERKLVVRESSGITISSDFNTIIIEIEPSCLEDLDQISGDALDPDDKKLYPTFDLHTSIKSDSDHLE